jgi:D-threo-aldose 1-dehydrogenase
VQTTFNTSIGPALEFLYGNRAKVRLGLGCASLMQLPSRRRRQALLAEAFEQGIRHFDVARMYGLGAVERELGRFAKGRRDEIGIATKFGIEPSGKVRRLAPLQAPARGLLAGFPALRERAMRNASALYTPRRYDAASACASLETSLRELGTDYVDVLFVHDPGAVSLPDMDELVGALEGLREAERIRAWGVSGEAGPVLLLGTGWPQSIPQLRNDIFSFAQPQTSSSVPPIYFGAVARALPRIHGRLLADDELRASWQRAIGLDCADPKVLTRLLLQDALDRNRDGAAIFATTQRERISDAAAAAEALRRGPKPPLEPFRRLVAAVDWRDGSPA